MCKVFHWNSIWIYCNFCHKLYKSIPLQSQSEFLLVFEWNNTSFFILVKLVCFSNNALFVHSCNKQMGFHIHIWFVNQEWLRQLCPSGRSVWSWCRCDFNQPVLIPQPLLQDLKLRHQVEKFTSVICILKFFWLSTVLYFVLSSYFSSYLLYALFLYNICFCVTALLGLLVHNWNLEKSIKCIGPFVCSIPSSSYLLWSQ